jgi:hypothetical protein
MELFISKRHMGASVVRLQKCRGTFLSFTELLENLMNRCTKEELDVFTVTAKKIWARRNAVIHDESFQHPSQLAREPWKR